MQDALGSALRVGAAVFAALVFGLGPFIGLLALAHRPTSVWLAALCVSAAFAWIAAAVRFFFYMAEYCDNEYTW